MWPSYIINLAENVTRLANSARQMDDLGIGWTRLEAVNGWALTDAEVAAVYDARENARRAKHPLVRPEIGCYLSHVDAWRRVAADDAHDGGFIFEDDFAATPDLPRALALLSRPQDGWDVVKLFSFEPTPRMVTDGPLGEGLRIGIPYRVPTCLIGYGITRQAAARLADGAVPFFRPVDEDMKFFWERGLRVALVSPQPVLVGPQTAETGTISGSRRAEAARRRGWGPAGMARNLRYQFDYAARLHFHRMLGHGR
jgi:glycosyl transferase family 25